MNQNSHLKLNHTTNSLYKQLKQALIAEKNNVQLQHKKLIKKRVIHTQNYHQSQPLSRSLTLNNPIIQTQDSLPSFALGIDLSKAQIKLSTFISPYQLRKQQQSLKMLNKSPKKIIQDQIYKTTSEPKSKQLKKKNQQRVHNFFKSSKTLKTQKSQNQQNMTYSVILKSIKQSEEPLLENHHRKQQNSNQSSNSLMQKRDIKTCDRCFNSFQQKPSMFFKNQEIKKNIELIQEMKNQFDQKHNQVEQKHFPQVQVLNFNYFNENKKKIINKVNSKQGIDSFNKMKLFQSRKKIYQTSCSKCKSLQKQMQKQNLHQKASQYQSNFNYFVYEYKSTGQQSTKSQRPTTKSQSSMYIKKHKLLTQNNCKNINQYKNLNSTTLSLNNVFQQFIKHNKIDVPPRPYTASVKTCNQIFHHRNSHLYHKEQSKLFNQENFVKPWQSSAEADNFF